MSAGLEGLGGTLTAQQVLTRMEALRQAQERELASSREAAVQRAQQAQQEFQQLAQAPTPQLPPEASFVPTLLSGIASVLTQDPGFRERAQAGIQQSRSALLQQRRDNLMSLRDIYSQRADEAQKLGELEVAEKYRRQYEGLSKQLDVVEDGLERQNRLDIANIQARATVARATARAAPESPENIEALADAVVGDQMGLSSVPAKMRPAVVGLIRKRGQGIPTSKFVSGLPPKSSYLAAERAAVGRLRDPKSKLEDKRNEVLQLKTAGFQRYQDERTPEQMRARLRRLRVLLGQVTMPPSLIAQLGGKGRDPQTLLSEEEIDQAVADAFSEEELDILAQMRR